MALFDTQSGDSQFAIPRNQYLTGDPNTDQNANTSWMAPSRTAPANPSPTTGINGGGGMSNISNQQPNPPSQTSNGTLLGSIAAGNVGQYMPWGYDQGKFNDPNKSDPKYDVGRILSKYDPSTQGLQQAMQELGPLGYRMTGKDTIVGPDGIPIDVGFAFGSGQGSHWQWNPNDPNAGRQGSMLGLNNQGGMNQSPYDQNNLMNMIWQALQGQRNFQNPAGQFNPTGGSVPQQGQQSPQQAFTTLIGQLGGTMPQQGMYNTIPQNPIPGMSYLT